MADAETKPAEIVVLPGIERRDLCGEPIRDVEVLQAAIDNGITDVVIVGRERDGKQYVASSGVDADKIVGQLFTAATMLATMVVKR